MVEPIKRVPIILDPERTMDINMVSNPKRIVLNDVLSRQSFDAPTRLKNELKESMGPELYMEMMRTRGIDFDVIEANTQDHGPVVSNIHLELEGGYTDATPLGHFDKEVLEVCMEAQQYGCPAITVEMVYKGITNAGEHNHTHPPTRKMIIDSVRRLMGHRITIDMQEICKKKHYKIEGYPNVQDWGKIESTILPGWLWTEAIVNGNLTHDVVKFDRPSPLFVVAQAKNQLLYYARCLLSVPNIMNTPQNIVIKNYTMERVMAIRHNLRKTVGNKSYGLYPTIKFDDIAHYSDINMTDKNQMVRLRKLVTKILDYIIPFGIIKDYSIVKDKYRRITGVELTIK